MKISLYLIIYAFLAVLYKKSLFIYDDKLRLYKSKFDFNYLWIHEVVFITLFFPVHLIYRFLRFLCKLVF